MKGDFECGFRMDTKSVLPAKKRTLPHLLLILQFSEEVTSQPKGCQPTSLLERAELNLQ